MTAFHRTRAWTQLRNRMRPVLASRLPTPCIDCGKPVLPTQTWQVGHVLSAAKYPAYALVESNLGASHKVCNLRSGGKDGAAVTNKRRARREKGEYFAW